MNLFPELAAKPGGAAGEPACGHRRRAIPAVPANSGPARFDAAASKPSQCIINASAGIIEVAMESFPVPRSELPIDQ
jgi:hypothetical protein